MTDLDVILREIYPHPVEKVWRAITSSQGLAAWLMRNDFEPRVGHECTFRFCASEDDDEDSLVFVRVLEIEAPRRMSWSWRNEEEAEASVVTFELREVSEGTELTLAHRGPVSDHLARELRQGWPVKIAALREHLATR